MARTSRVRRQIVVENKEVTERNGFNIVNFVNFVKLHCKLLPGPFGTV